MPPKRRLARPKVRLPGTGSDADETPTGNRLALKTKELAAPPPTFPVLSQVVKPFPRTALDKAVACTSQEQCKAARETGFYVVPSSGAQTRGDFEVPRFVDAVREGKLSTYDELLNGDKLPKTITTESIPAKDPGARRAHKRLKQEAAQGATSLTFAADLLRTKLKKDSEAGDDDEQRGEDGGEKKKTEDGEDEEEDLEEDGDEEEDDMGGGDYTENYDDDDEDGNEAFGNDGPDEGVL